MHEIIHAKRESHSNSGAFCCFCNFTRILQGNITPVEKGVENVQNPVWKGFQPVAHRLFFV